MESTDHLQRSCQQIQYVYRTGFPRGLKQCRGPEGHQIPFSEQKICGGYSYDGQPCATISALERACSYSKADYGRPLLYPQKGCSCSWVALLTRALIEGSTVYVAACKGPMKAGICYHAFVSLAIKGGALRLCCEKTCAAFQSTFHEQGVRV